MSEGAGSGGPAGRTGSAEAGSGEPRSGEAGRGERGESGTVDSGTTERAPDEDAYGGVLGAFPYAARTSDSRALRSYVAVAALVVVVSLLVFVPALVAVVAATVGQSAVVAVVRGWIVLVWLGVVAPTVAPVLLVARRHRRGRAVHARYDLAMALTGYCFLLALYAGLLATAPPDLRGTPTGPGAPLVEALYGLSQPAGVAIPVGAAVLEGVVHRWLG